MGQDRICRLLAENINAESLACWPLSWGVPLPAGRLQPDEPLVIRSDDGVYHPAQGRALALHPDGSIRRLLVHGELPMAAETVHEYSLCQDQAPSAGPAATVDGHRLSGAAGAVVLQPTSLQLLRGGETCTLLVEATGGLAGEAAQVLTCRWSHLEPVHPGPITASAVVVGCLLQAGMPLARLALTVQLFQQTPIINLSLEVTNRSRATLQLRRLHLSLQAPDIGWETLTAEIRHFNANGPEAQTLPCEIRSDHLEIAVNGVEKQSRLISYNETWLALAGATEVCCLSVPDFLENYPYGLQLEHDRWTLACWPAWRQDPWTLVRGCGKTHRLSLGFASNEDVDWPQAFGYACGKAPLTRVAWEDLQAAGAMSDMPQYLPDTYPRLESTLYDITYNRNRGFGKMNYGDDYSPLYTNQGRGQGEIVWNNLEGDYPFHMFCQFQRTGHYLYWKEFMASIQHWSDVDFADHTGALIVHSAGHTTGSSTPCHNWAEGFREWYYATGDPRPKAIIAAMGNWLKEQWQQGFFRLDPQPYVRGCGWGLIQLAAIQEVQEDVELKTIILTMAEDLLDYCRTHDGLVMQIPTGGNHIARDNAFHSATVAMGAERCYRLYPEPVLRDLALAATEPLMDRRTCSPEGIAVYISGPEQDFPMQQAAAFALGALATAWRLQPEIRYIRRGMRMLEYCLDRGMIVDHMRIPGEFLQRGDDIIISPQLLMPNTQLSSYQLRGLLLFMKAAHEADLLKTVDYRW